jgi:hypothetical protein
MYPRFSKLLVNACFLKYILLLVNYAPCTNLIKCIYFKNEYFDVNQLMDKLINIYQEYYNE